jgi:hypothetical protein
MARKRALRKILPCLSVSLLAPCLAAAQAITVFSGVPSIRVSESGLDRSLEQLPRGQASNLGVVISKIGEKYYWATRSNKELVPHAGGAYVTFVAVDGAGYVRIIAPDAKNAVALLSPRENTFDYVEHLLTGLHSVTYYGSSL